MSAPVAPVRAAPLPRAGPLSTRRDEPGGPVGGGPAWWPIAAELALVGVTASAVIGLARLFSDGSFIVPVLIAVVFSHAVASVGRHIGLPPTLAGLVSALAVLLITALVVEPSTTTAGLPLLKTWQALGRDLHDAWQRFGEVKAPTPVVPGFVAAAACGAGLAGAVADGLAFRARARFEALAPTFTLFMVGALLGSDRYRIATTALYLAAVLVFVLVSAPIGRGNQVWVGGRSTKGEAALLRGGLVTATVALVVGLVVGPHLPGAHSLGLVGVRDGSPKGSSSRVTVSPLVDIRNRLVDQSSTQLFTVESDRPSYWRLTSLGRFDGNIWSSLGSYQPASGQLSDNSHAMATGPPVYQRFAVSALSSIWLPAAYRPQRFEGTSGIRYDADSASLLTDAPSSDGLRYSVLSKQPAATAEQLAAARVVAPGDDLTRYLELPADFPARVARQAVEVTAGAGTPYDKARALQDWFRSSFTYDLNVPPGHDDSAIERFLFVTRRGYCEQFAGTYAAMARSLGLPARVAVGFTAGEKAGDGMFHVTGKEAHAWPEVFFPGYGWMAFEPTPGRAVPASDSYTGVSPEAPGPASPPTSQAPATTTPANTTPSDAPTSQAPAIQTPTSAPAPARSSGGGGPSGILLAIAALVVVAILYVVGVPYARRARRARLRAAATTPTAQVIRSWREAEEDLSITGVRAGPSETAHEFAARAGSGAGSDRMAGALADLADQWTAASYSPDGVGAAEAERAGLAAEAVRSDVAARATWLQRLRWMLDPRPLLQRHRPSTG